MGPGRPHCSTQTQQSRMYCIIQLRYLPSSPLELVSAAEMQGPFSKLTTQELKLLSSDDIDDRAPLVCEHSISKAFHFRDCRSYFLFDLSNSSSSFALFLFWVLFT